jgi:hypothetical protein
MERGPKKSHNDLSTEFIRATFTYKPSTGQLFWKAALSRRTRIGDVAGCLDDQGRIRIGIHGKDYFAHRIIWVLKTGKWPEYEIDHRDEVKSNNRWKNLREATPSQNHRNRGMQKNNTSGYKGVCYVAKRKRYIAGVKLNGYRHNLGSFMTAEEAYAAYCEAAERLHGKEFMKV